MTWVFDDGGRAAAGFTGETRDCVTRAIAIATGLPYQQVYDDLNGLERGKAVRRRRVRPGSARTGINKDISRAYLTARGWTFVPTMAIGQGCKVHLRADELPSGRVIAAVSRHFCAVVDGVIRDTHDPSREGRRCVYGVYLPPDRRGPGNDPIVTGWFGDDGDDDGIDLATDSEARHSTVIEGGRRVLRPRVGAGGRVADPHGGGTRGVVQRVAAGVGAPVSPPFREGALMSYAVEHIFLSFGCLHTATIGDFATEAEARAVRDDLERQYREWRAKRGNAGPVPRRSR